MQNKGLIWTFIVLLSLACLYQLSFTWVAQGVESDAKEFAGDSTKLEERYLDSIGSKEVYPIIGYTYNEVRKNVLNLGLDLKGGMNVTLEVSVVDVVKALASTKEDDEGFLEAITLAKEMQRDNQDNFVNLFERAWNETQGDRKLTAIFYNIENKDQLDPKSTNEEVIEFIRSETNGAFERSFRVLRTRVNLFGVAQPNIQKLDASDRILVELPGVKDKDRVRQLLQGTAKLEFWATYQNAEVYPYLIEANEKLSYVLGGRVEENDSIADADSTAADQPEVTEVPEDIQEVAAEDLTDALPDSSIADSSEEGSSLLDQLAADTDPNDTTAGGPQDPQLSPEEYKKQNPLFAVMPLYAFPTEDGQFSLVEGPVVGRALIRDTAQVNEYLRMPELKEIFPRTLKFYWGAQADKESGTILFLYAMKVETTDGSAKLEGDVVTDAFQDFSPGTGSPNISMSMNPIGAQTWKRMTAENDGKFVAIALDQYVYSAPRVNGVIPNGRTSIEGQFSIEEAKLISNILKAGKLPAPAKIVEEAVVGPSLGQEAINSGLRSFLVALVIVLLYMIFYYGKAGIASDIALFANLFFIMGVLASTNIALTLPGIAGIVLTIGISVDANVLIYERIREELRAGKGSRLAVADGYKNAYSSIIDANVTTLLTGIILWFFGTGPVEGFAKTLVIGIITSLFCAIFITRLIFAWRLDNKKKVTVATKATEGAFQNMKWNFITKRKTFYVISSIIILAGVASFAVRGLSYGVDFTGGRTYLVRFDQSVTPETIRKDLQGEFATAPEVKTFGDDNQVKITTSFMIDSEDEAADKIVEEKLFNGLAAHLGGVDMAKFSEKNLMSSQKVGPTIADDIKKDSILAIVFSLIVIFLYILLRFRKWQYGLGAVAAIFHDVLVVLSVFSIAYGFLPFSLDIDQAFIAAILTVVGYSINDTVVVFDRIREYLGSYKKREMKEVINDALNSTLSRTINTSLSTFFVLLMIFIFGGEVIRGFAFALLVGVAVGTYSSLCVATPIVVDLSKEKEEKAKK